MRIAVEKLKNIHVYRDMPAKQREFLKTITGCYDPKSGKYIFFLDIDRRRYRSSIDIGFDRNGKLFIDPKSHTKTGQISMTKEEIVKLFDRTIEWLSAAARNGFLDLETEEDDGGGN